MKAQIVRSQCGAFTDTEFVRSIEIQDVEVRMVSDTEGS
jgi:hypothetical protein